MSILRRSGSCRRVFFRKQPRLAHHLFRRDFVRNPINTGARRRSSFVHEVNFTTQTSSGFTQVTSPMSFGTSLSTGFFVISGLIFSNTLLSDCCVNPEPTLPA